MMEELAMYLFKAAICSTVFLGIYACFFRSQTFFRFNRHFLISGLILSILLPLYTHTYQVTISTTGSGGMPELTQAKPSASNYFWIYLTLSAYGLGILFLLVRYLLGLIRIKAIVNRAGYHSMHDYRLVNTGDFSSSFSIYNYIFIDKSASLSNTEKELILTHELAHVRQYHWIDLMIAQLFCTMQWFNPIAWLYLKAIRQNHEYLADESVLQQGTSAAIYRAVLVNHCIGTRVFSFSSSFYEYSMPRIKMLSKPSSGWIRKVAAVLVLPAFIAFYWAFSEAKITVKVSQADKMVNTQIAPVKIEMPSKKDIPAVTVKRKSKPIKPYVRKNNEVTAVVTDTAKTSSANNTNLITSAQPVPKSSPLYFIDGIEVPPPDLNKIDNNTIAEIHVLKDEMAVTSYGIRGRNGVILITTKKNLN